MISVTDIEEILHISLYYCTNTFHKLCISRRRNVSMYKKEKKKALGIVLRSNIG